MARFWGKRYSPEAEAQSRVLRIEATSHDLTFFRHHRQVVGRDGREEYRMAALKKSIYSLSDVVEIWGAACLRYLDFIGPLEDRTPARLDLDRISAPVRDPRERSWRGFNLFLKEDRIVLLALLRGEFAINGLSHKRLRALLPEKSSGQIARLLRRRRLHHLLKRVGHTSRYYLTALGRRLITASCKLLPWIILPSLQPALA